MCCSQAVSHDWVLATSPKLLRVNRRTYAEAFASLKLLRTDNTTTTSLPFLSPSPYSTSNRHDVGVHRVSTFTTPHTQWLLTSSQGAHIAHLQIRHQVRRHPPRDQQRKLDRRPRECQVLRHGRPPRQPGRRGVWLGQDLRVHRLPRQRCERAVHCGGAQGECAAGDARRSRDYGRTYTLRILCAHHRWLPR